MITIDSYTKFTESLKETGALSKDFHIIQYSEGCCLGVDGKSKEFEDEALENADYILWDKFGIAYRTLNSERPGVVIGEDGVSIQQVPQLVPYPPFNHPQAIYDLNEVVFSYVDAVFDMCRKDNRTVFFMCSSPKDAYPIKTWAEGTYSVFSSALVESMRKYDKFRAAVTKAVRLVDEAEPKNRPTES